MSTTNDSENMYLFEQQTQPMSVDYLPSDIKLSSGSPEPSMSAADITKPTRPLTAYHLYFQLEREHIIQTTKSDDGTCDEIALDNRPLGIELDDSMPARYHALHLSQNWFATGKEKRGSADQKRKHRKTHGKIAFLDLSKTIASRWATLEETDPETKLYCDRIAKRELGVYKEKVKAYKASLSDAPTNSLPTSFSSSVGTTVSSASSSPTFNMPPVGATQSSLSMSASDATSFQLSSDFHPEWLGKGELSPERPAKSAGNSLPSVTSTNSTNVSKPDPSLAEWWPEHLSVDLMSKQQASIASTLTNATNPNIRSTNFQSKSMNSESVAENDFTFHPVPDEVANAEDTFLKKYRKAARRTSLFSIRPLHHQVTPLSQSLSCDGKSNIALSEVMEYENITSESPQRRGFGSIQRRLRNELDERMSLFKAGLKRGQVQPMPLKSVESLSKDEYTRRTSRKRLSSTLPEGDRGNSEHLKGFTIDDANMLITVLSDTMDEDGSAP